MNCDDARIALGAFVLGALEPAERYEVDRHVRHCADCRAELAELAPLPGLLGRLSLADVSPTPATAAPTPPPDLLNRLLREAAAERAETGRSSRGRSRFATRRWMAAAAGLLLVVGAVSVTAVSRQSSSPNHAIVATATDPATSVVVRTVVRQRDWGTAIDVQLHGVAPGERCRLIAVGRDGRQDVAASWQATYEGRADVSGATAIPTPALSALRVVTDGGRVLAAVPVHG
jgi:anti-sigma factor RsiW